MNALPLPARLRLNVALLLHRARVLLTDLALPLLLGFGAAASVTTPCDAPTPPTIVRSP